MSSNIYEDLLRDIIKEINGVAEDFGNSENSEFDRGYRSGMMIVMKAIQDEILAFNIPKSDLKFVDVDEWFRDGIA